jgi:sugar/nucleoside kinase (ribokinase family)
MATFLGPAATLTASEISDDTIRLFDCVYLEGYLIGNEPLFLPILQRIKQAGLKIALDLSNFNIVNGYHDLLRRVVPEYVNILFSNESEAEAYTGLKAELSIEEISAQVDISIVTIGSRGALVAGKNQQFHIPPEKRNPIDTTGAGDNFAAGFLFGQSVGASIKQSAHIGSLLSGYVIETIGSQIPDSCWDEIKLKVKTFIV